LSRDAYSFREFGNTPSKKLNDKQRTDHLRRTLSPQAINTAVDTVAPAFKPEGENLDYSGNIRSKGQAVINALGIKNKSFDLNQLRSTQQNNTNYELYEIDKAITDAEQGTGDYKGLSEDEKAAIIAELNQKYDKLVNEAK